MGRHNKIEPKKISLLGTAGGIFATVLLAAGLFGASGLVNDSHLPWDIPGLPGAESNNDQNVIKSDRKDVNVGTAGKLTPPPVQPTAPVAVVPAAPVKVVPPQDPAVPPRIAPVAPQSPQPPTEAPKPPVLPPTPKPRAPAVDVEIDVDTPIVGIDTRLRVGVPLVGPAVEAVEDTVDVIVTKVIEIPPHLLGK